MTDVEPVRRSGVPGRDTVLIVGAGHAGVALAVALVKADHPGTVTIVLQIGQQHLGRQP